MPTVLVCLLTKVNYAAWKLMVYTQTITCTQIYCCFSHVSFDYWQQDWNSKVKHKPQFRKHPNYTRGTEEEKKDKKKKDNCKQNAQLCPSLLLIPIPLPPPPPTPHEHTHFFILSSTATRHTQSVNQKKKHSATKWMLHQSGRYMSKRMQSHTCHGVLADVHGVMTCGDFAIFVSKSSLFFHCTIYCLDAMICMKTDI